MSKSVSYSVVPRKNPQEPEAGVRFYAQAQASGDVWGIQRSGFFNGRGKWAKGFENQMV